MFEVFGRILGFCFATLRVTFDSSLSVPSCSSSLFRRRRCRPRPHRPRRPRRRQGALSPFRPRLGYSPQDSPQLATIISLRLSTLLSLVTQSSFNPRLSLCKSLILSRLSIPCNALRSIRLLALAFTNGPAIKSSPGFEFASPVATPHPITHQEAGHRYLGQLRSGCVKPSTQTRPSLPHFADDTRDPLSEQAKQDCEIYANNDNVTCYPSTGDQVFQHQWAAVVCKSSSLYSVGIPTVSQGIVVVPKSIRTIWSTYTC